MNKTAINHGYKEASAGTGKTYWIVEEKLKELNDQNVAFDRILIVTFTEKAAGELRNRIRGMNFNNVNVDNMHIFTIHSFCQRVLKDYAVHAGQPFELNLVNAGSDASYYVEKWVRDDLPKNEEVFNIIKDHSDDLAKDVVNLSSDLTKAIQTYSISMTIEPVQEGDDDWYSNFLSSIVKDIYLGWQKDKAQRKVQTYNDMITSVHDAVFNNPALCTDLENRYDGAIIDEFQDTNQLQWDIFRRIFNNDSHFLYVVGDPKQSIYAFQGADVNVYNNAIGKLQRIDDKLVNYRSSNGIIKACNELFERSDFFNTPDSHIRFYPSGFPDNNRDGLDMELRGKDKIDSIWFSAPDVDEYSFAEFAVDCMKYCCEMKDGKTNLQIPRKKERRTEDGKKEEVWEMDNVSYKDFAVLARTTSEMPPIEQEMRKKGVPYVRYKEKTLFNGLECQNWISLLSAVDSEDFAGHKRRILNEALFTKFFNVELEAVGDKKYDSPSDSYRKLFLRWHRMSESRRWTELIESIFENTGIEERLASEDRLQSIVKFRQIGNYILEYLYDNGCSLSDVCTHLAGSAFFSGEEDVNLVERGTDKPCVQVMTIHASKGLEFPIVISVAGFKRINTHIENVYTYHSYGEHFIGFSGSAYKEYRKEENQEWRRLFYVAFTRARELLILPRYTTLWESVKEYSFLKTAIDMYLKDKAPMLLSDIIKPSFRKQINDENVLDDSLFENRKREIEETYNKSKGMNTFKYSYSSLSHPHKNSVEETNSGNTDNDEDQTSHISLKEFDPNRVPIPFGDNESEKAKREDIKDYYPRGTALGTAVHEVFEKAVFSDYKTDCDEEDSLCESDNSINSDLENLIQDCFRKQAVRFDKDGKILKETKRIVWNTLNAKIPTIKGNHSVENNSFRLSELDESQKRAEVEFFLSPVEQDVLKKYCNGFVDLIFNRNGIYSILDWKTDTKTNDGKPIDYSSFNCLKDRVDEAYSIQRVLYSYCLIKWLKQWYPEDDEEIIFNNRFGGIYYVFVRGCVKGKRNGIYAQTWESWNDLKSAFDKIKSQKMFIYNK